MLQKIYNEVSKLATTAQKALENSPDLTIEIFDEICALAFRKYAQAEVWDDKEDELLIKYDDSWHIQVSEEDFFRYHLYYTPAARALSCLFADHLNDLKDVQQIVLKNIINTPKRSGSFEDDPTFQCEIVMKSQKI